MQQNTTKLTIREGGFYRTRDGRKVGPVTLGRGGAYSWVAPEVSEWPVVSAWYENGMCFTLSSTYDLIAEWRDEGTLRELDVKPGDVVEYTLTGVVTTVTRFDGSDYFGTGDNPDAPYSQTARFRIVSRAPAATDDATIQRVMEASAPSVDDPVSHPAHYTSHPSGVECLTITRWMGFNLGNAMKYIWRADMKGAAIEDLRKAAFYIADEISKREADGVIDPASYRVEARG